MAQCTNCVSNKRQSPSDSYPQQPSSKRAALEQPSSSASSSGEQLLLQDGFTKIPLTSIGLRRTLSSPVPTKNLSDQFSDVALASSLISNPLAEENSGHNAAKTSQQPLYRTYSEPILEGYQLVPTSASPRPPAIGKVSCQPGLLKQESPATRRFRRMKKRMREMSKWWDEVIKEGEEEGEDGSENSDHSPPKDDCEASRGNEIEGACHHDQEAVWVEKKGEVLILHFTCPCGKGYQILLSEKNCYYKLSSF